MHHDCSPVPSCVLDQQRICSSKNRGWYSCFVLSSFTPFTVLNPLYRTATVIQWGLEKTASRFQRSKVNTKIKPNNTQSANEHQNYSGYLVSQDLFVMFSSPPYAFICRKGRFLSECHPLHFLKRTFSVDLLSCETHLN